MSSTESNKQLVADLFEHGSQGRFDEFPNVIAADYVCHPEEARGAAGLRAMVEGYRDGIGGLSVTVDHQIADGDYVATRFTVRGRHDGELLGVAPTGNAIEVTGLTVSRCRNGLIEEEWELIDAPGLLAQIGALPVPAGA